MRVISGTRKGHRLKSVKGMDVRPTEDRVKESLFNILGHISSQAVVLDCFAGSGSIGIEFLSRGAKEVYFIDRSINSIRAINENLGHTRLEEGSQVIKSDIKRFLKMPKYKLVEFDYIYIDPPYMDIDVINEILSIIYTTNRLSSNGIIMVEHSEEINFNDSEFILYDIRDYGSKKISFLKNK